MIGIFIAALAILIIWKAWDDIRQAWQKSEEEFTNSLPKKLDRLLSTDDLDTLFWRSDGEIIEIWKMLSGSLFVGDDNRVYDPEGKPTGIYHCKDHGWHSLTDEQTKKLPKIIMKAKVADMMKAGFKSGFNDGQNP